MTSLFRWSLWLAGVVNFLPVLAPFLSAGATGAYGLENVDVNQLVLLQHRAILFGILGAASFYLLFRKEHDVAFYLLLASMLSFVLLVTLSETVNQFLLKVFWIDVAMVALIVACRSSIALSNAFRNRQFS